MRPRWRKVFSDLWDNKMRTLLVVASIAIGVFSIGMIAGTYEIISQDMGASYASANPANIVLHTDPYDDNLLDSIKTLEGVKEAEGRHIFSASVRLPGSDWHNIDLVAIKDFSDTNINLLVPVQGNPIPENKQVLLESQVLDELSVKVGDVLEFQLPNGRIKSMSVAGIVQDQTTAAGDFLSPPLSYITIDTLPWLGQPTTYNRLFATVNGDSNDLDHIREVSATVADKLDKSDVQILRTQLNQTNKHPMASTVQAILGILMALGILIVFLSSSLIANTLNSLLTQHLPHIGVMKLIGARSQQIFGMYMVLILFFGIIALLIALPTGGQAAYLLSDYVASKMNFNLQGYRIVPLAYLLQIIVAILVPLAAGFIPIINGSRVKVQAAINGTALNGGKSSPGWLERLGSRVKWLSRPLLISLRNTFRRKRRLLLTLFTLTIGGAIFIGVFNVQLSLNDFILMTEKYFIADVTLNFDRPYRLDEIKQVVMNIPHVKAVEGWSFASADIIRQDETVADYLTILAPPADSKLIAPIMLEGRWLQPGDTTAITVSEAIWTIYPDIKPGDQLKLKINGQEDEWTVVGIFRFLSRDQIIAYATYEYVSRLINLPNQSFSYRVVTDQHTLAYQEQMSSTIDTNLRKLGYHVSDTQAGLSTLKTASESLAILINFLLVMALLTAAVGSIGLTGTMGMNVMERTREIGVMRAIGATDKQIMRTVMVEGMIIGVISWFLAAIASFPITLLLNRIISLAIFNSPSKFMLNPYGFLIWLGLVLILSAVASVLPARNAARLTIREVLAYE
ncbi:MAG: ABC transporter permease [Anaerolineales bacterium]|nr:ABC transporter permease [Anaerolineae bacterium]PWB55801.1 MAG: ABC transporter permease [Anaerolineales bacterium]